MKIFYFIMIVLIGIFLNFSMIHASLSANDTNCYVFIRQFTKKIKNKYNVQLSAIGCGNNQGIWLMTANFHRKGSLLTKEEARQLIIEFSEEFLKNVNSNQKIRPFLRDFPFTSKNIHLGMINFDSQGNDVFHPYIGTVSVVKGKIFYCTEDPEDSYIYKSTESEIYEEALKNMKSK